MLNFSRFIKTQKPKDEVVASIENVIPYIKLEDNISRAKVGFEFERLKKEARKVNKYYFHGGPSKYLIEKNSKKVDIYSPRVVMNFEDVSDEVILKLDFKYKSLENGMFFAILLLGLYFSGAFYTSILTITFGCIMLGMIFLPGIIMFRRKSRKLLEMLEGAIS